MVEEQVVEQVLEKISDALSKYACKQELTESAALHKLLSERICWLECGEHIVETWELEEKHKLELVLALYMPGIKDFSQRFGITEAYAIEVFIAEAEGIIVDLGMYDAKGKQGCEGIANSISEKFLCMDMSRKDILEAATRCVCEERQDQYGDAESNFELIAKLWSAYLGYAIEAKDVATMMIMLKFARVKTGEPKPDNWIDIAGYAACGGELENKKPPSDESGKDGRPCYYYTIKV